MTKPERPRYVTQDDTPNEPFPTLKDQFLGKPEKYIERVKNVEISPEARVALALAGYKPVCNYCDLWTPSDGNYEIPMTGICHAHESEPHTMSLYGCKDFTLSAGSNK